MRGAFNATFEASYGARSTAGPPGVTYVSGVPCRFVPQTRISQGEFPFTLSQAWLTNDAVDLNDPDVTSQYLGQTTVDWLSGDTVVVSSQPGKVWTVCREEVVNPFTGAAYLRWLLVDLALVQYPPWQPPNVPPEAPPGPPGDTCPYAGFLEVGQTLSGLLAPPELWYRWFSRESDVYRFTDLGSSSNCYVQAWKGDCSALVFHYAWFPTAGPFQDLGFDANVNYLLQVNTIDTLPGNLDVLFERAP